jgi:hypothetical protein
MPYLQRLKHDLKAGWAALRYGAVQAANRALEETELLRLRLELRKLDERIKDLYRDIGERAIELHERGEPAEQALTDSQITQGAEQVAVLKAERAKLLREIDETRPPD